MRLPKKGGGGALRQFSDLRGGFGKKEEGDIFEGGWYPNAHYDVETHYLQILLCFRSLLSTYIVSYIYTLREESQKVSWQKNLMVLVLTLFRMGLFMSGGSKKAPFPKICLTYPTMMKLAVILYLKQIQKSYKHVTHLLSSAGITIFSPEMNHFVISRYTDINCILQMIPNSFNFFCL